MIRNLTDALRPLTAHTRHMSPRLLPAVVLRFRRRRRRLDELTPADRARISRNMRASLEALTGRGRR